MLYISSHEHLKETILMSQNQLELLFMEHYAPNRCGPGGGGVRVNLNEDLKFL